ncbi:MAG: hypothetical protein Q9227_005637 [Pyrenula ochraceoflavens]
METFAGRLASFEVAHPTSKRRASNAKGPKALTWPLRNLSPTELAQAGFYYKPSVTAPDNTCCFLCDRNLDGWEEEDDAIVEHLRHSKDCGWAITMSAAPDGYDPNTIEDPTSQRMSNARKETFKSWPHESKRGWTCKVQKMVDAGWYHCPTPECDDFVTCAYCKLSLDGWEPKDNPFDEHYRRSPDCAFFAFAGVSAPKPTKGRKGRTSKASRLSAQSTQTVDPIQEDSIDLNDSIEARVISQNTVVSTTSKMGGAKGKKTTKRKGKATRQKKEVPAEGDEDPTIIEIATTRDAAQKTRGKKRTSEQISEDDNNRGARESTVRPEPPAKRRATRTRKSALENDPPPVINDAEESTVEKDATTPPRATRGGRKRASSTRRKVSTASTASKASMRAALPNEAEIEAQLEAELDKPLSDEEMVDEAPHRETQRKVRGKGKVGQKTASTAPTRRGRKAQPDHFNSSMVEQSSTEQQSEALDTSMTGMETLPGDFSKTEQPTKREAGSKRTGRIQESSATVQSEHSIATAEPRSSMLDESANGNDSGHETDASTVGKAGLKKGTRKKTTTKGRPKKGAAKSKNIEDVVQPSQPPPSMPREQELTTGNDQHRNDDKPTEATEAATTEQEPKKNNRTKGNKTKKVASKPKKATKAPHLSMPGAFSPSVADETPEPEATQDEEDQSQDSLTAMLDSMPVPPALLDSKSPQQAPVSLAQRLSDLKSNSIEPAAAEERPARAQNIENVPDVEADPKPARQTNQNKLPVQQSKPTTTKRALPPPPCSPTPQSSDAENAPPSTRPENKRPPLHSPPQATTTNTTTTTTTKVPLAASTPPRTRTPLSPLKQPITGGAAPFGALHTSHPWTAVDIETAFLATASPGQDENEFSLFSGGKLPEMSLTSPEKKMTVEEWIRWNAARAEEELKREAERVVGVFERMGGEAVRGVEGIEVVE